MASGRLLGGFTGGRQTGREGFRGLRGVVGRPRKWVPASGVRKVMEVRARPGQPTQPHQTHLFRPKSAKLARFSGAGDARGWDQNPMNPPECAILAGEKGVCRLRIGRKSGVDGDFRDQNRLLFELTAIFAAEIAANWS